MKQRNQLDFRLITMLLVLTLFGAGCTTPENEAEATLSAAPSASPSPPPTPPVSSEPDVTPIPVATSLPDDMLYADNFKNVDSGWPNALKFENYFVGYHEPNFFHVQVSAQNDRVVLALPEREFDDATVETEVLVDKDNTAPEGDFRYGLAVRRQGNSYYAFTISPRTGSWYVLKSSPTSVDVIAEGTVDSLQGLTALDKLRVDFEGSTTTFYINDQTVSQVIDPDFPSGEVGFFVETFDAPQAHIHYDSLTIAEVKAPPALYADNFKNVDSGWPNALAFENYFVGYHEPNFFHVQVSAQNDRVVLTLPERDFDNATVETEVLVDKDNTAPEGDFRYGLAVRRQGNSYYAFTISPRTGSWYVLKSSPTSLETLQEGTLDSIEGLQNLDTLCVVASGPAVTFNINGTTVSQVIDPDYISGEVGFFVETLDARQSHIHYDSLSVRDVDTPNSGCT